MVVLEKLKKLTDKWDGIKFPPSSEYWDYSFREKVKHLAWGLIYDHISEKNYNAAAFYLLHGVITSHYWRAREVLERSGKCKKYLRMIMGDKYYPGYILDIDHYTCHWLCSNQDRPDLYPKEVIDSLFDQFHYKPEKNKYLPEGMTEYSGFEFTK